MAEHKGMNMVHSNEEEERVSLCSAKSRTKWSSTCTRDGRRLVENISNEPPSVCETNQILMELGGSSKDQLKGKLLSPPFRPDALGLHLVEASVKVVFL